MASRLLLLAHGATLGTRSLVFGDRTPLADPGAEVTWPERMVSLSSGPEPACTATAARSGREFDVAPALAGLDAGHWSGRDLHEMATADPDGLRGWLSDATATPHGGESLAALITRVGHYCDGRSWPPGRSVAVVSPLVARAMAVHALAAPANVIFRLDVGPLGSVALSRQTSGWRLQHLGPGR